MREYSTNLKQIDGGKTILSGDISSTFGYQLLDEDLKILNLISGIGTLSIINKDDNLCYVRESVTVTNGELSFNLPILKESLYQIFIEINGYKFPSNGSTFIYVEKNPDEIIMETIPPLTLSDYLTEYAKTTDLPDLTEYVKTIDLPTLTDYALKTDVPSVVGLATETYVDNKIGLIPTPDLTGLATETYVTEQINGISAPDLSGIATEIYVQDQISLIPSVDTSQFLTKPLSEPIDLSDPVTKNYVDNALLGVGGGSGVAGTWTTIASGQYDLFQYNAYTYMVANGYTKFKVLVSVNSDADSFLLHLLHGGGSAHLSASTFNNTTKQTVEGETTSKSIIIETGKALIELDYEFVGPAYLDLGNQNGRLKVTITSDSWGILSSYSTTTTSYSYLPNLNRLLALNGTSTGASTVKVDTFVNSTTKTVKGVFLGFK